jgi:plasmid stabilization system protein ParE
VPTRTIELHEEAAADYDAAFDWYLEHSAEAARAFDAEFEHALGQIARNPERWARGSYQTHRFLLRRFPYLVVYRELGPITVQVLAVAHTSRRPDYWKNRT